MAQKKSKELTPKQERFCMEYMICMNATSAAKSAGYKSSDSGYHLMCNPLIKERIEILKSQIVASQLVTIEYILSGLTEVVDRCLQKEPAYIWDPIKHCRVQAKTTDDKPIYQFDSQGANKALELLGKYAGLFDKDNQQRINPLNNKAELTNEQFNKLIEAATKGIEIDF